MNAACGRTPHVSVMEEAEHITLDSTSTLLPSDCPETVEYVARSITEIRSTYPCVSKVRNTGSRLLGAVKVYNYTSDMYCRLDGSKFGPLKTIIRQDPTTVIAVFAQPYNPTVLAKCLAMECGIRTWPAWLETPDFGEITYNPKTHAFTFRQGLENCGADCSSNKEWTFIRVQRGWVIQAEFQTGIPLENTTTPPPPPAPCPCN